jgi:hypothetical protein
VRRLVTFAKVAQLARKLLGGLGVSRGRVILMSYITNMPTKSRSVAVRA